MEEGIQTALLGGLFSSSPGILPIPGYAPPMMNLLRDAGPLGYLSLLWAGFAFLVCAVSGILLGLRWKVPPVLATFPLGVQSLLGLAGTAWMMSKLDLALKNVDAEQHLVLQVAGTSESYAGYVLGAAAIPAACVLLLGASVGGMRGKKSWGASVGAFLVMGLVSLLPISALASVSGEWRDFVEGAVVRLLLYGMLGLGVSMSAAGNDSKSGAPESNISGALAAFFAIATFETASRAWDCYSFFRAVASAAPESRNALLSVLSTWASTWPIRSFTIFFALLPVAISLFRSPAPLSDEEVLSQPDPNTPLRGAGQFLALWLIPVVLYAWFDTDYSDLIEAMLAAAKAGR